MTLEELGELLRSLVNVEDLIAVLEVGDQAMKRKLIRLIQQEMPAAPFHTPITINPFLGPHAILGRSAKGEPLKLFIWSEEKILMLDFKRGDEAWKNLYSFRRGRWGDHAPEVIGIQLKLIEEDDAPVDP